jgi:hypothetical protein
MGRVYKARDKRLDRFVAIKLLAEARSTDADRRARFVQEAKAFRRPRIPIRTPAVGRRAVERAAGERAASLFAVGRVFEKTSARASHRPPSAIRKVSPAHLRHARAGCASASR